MPEDTDPRDGWGTQASPRRAEPDAHGQAALLLSESILHALVEANTLTLDQAVGVVRIASEVKVEVAEETGESEGQMRRSLGLLSEIERSLTADGSHGGNGNVHVLPV